MYIPFPKLLHPGIAKNLNLRTYNSTGCFYFLNTDTLPLYHSIEAENSFQALIMILYCLYHDYGRGFLKACLNEKLVPPGMKLNKDLMDQRRQAEIHVRNVCETLRAGLCHGLFPYNQLRNKLPKVLDEYCNTTIASTSNNWNSIVIKINKYTQKNWNDAKVRLTQESDSMYDYLWVWSDWWNNENDGQKKQLRQNFLDFSLKTLDMSIVNPIMEKECSFYYNINYQNKKRELQKALPGFQSDIQNKLLSGICMNPEEIYQALVRFVQDLIAPPPTSSVQKSQGTPFDVTW